MLGLRYRTLLANWARCSPVETSNFSPSQPLWYIAESNSSQYDPLDRPFGMARRSLNICGSFFPTEESRRLFAFACEIPRGVAASEISAKPRFRAGGIRTPDPLHPMQVRYQTAPQPARIGKLRGAESARVASPGQVKVEPALLLTGILPLMMHSWSRPVVAPLCRGRQGSRRGLRPVAAALCRGRQGSKEGKQSKA